MNDKNDIIVIRILLLLCLPTFSYHSERSLLKTYSPKTEHRKIYVLTNSNYFFVDPISCL
jgi:hypothetical protein